MNRENYTVPTSHFKPEYCSFWHSFNSGIPLRFVPQVVVVHRNINSQEERHSMIGCHIGRFFQVTVAGGSYQEGLTAVVQPPRHDLHRAGNLWRSPAAKTGCGRTVQSPQETRHPVLYTRMNSADTVENAHNANLTNGSPITLLIPNLDRHFIHIKQYQDTNRTPRPGHASYASFVKYGAADDSIGAGIFSGRYTSTIVGAGYMAKKILKAFGIKVFSYIKEAAGIPCPKMEAKAIFEYTEKHKKMRHDADPFIRNCSSRDGLKPTCGSCIKWRYWPKWKTRSKRSAPRPPS
jgi:chorismate synthase